MVERSISVKLSANVAGWVANMKVASNALKNVANESGQLGQKMSTRMRAFHEAGKLQAEGWRKAGSAALGFGATMAAGLGYATKAAVAWESAFAGVRKTVDATEEQYRVLDAQLRNMAGSVSASHDEIAGVAEAAGQLGVARENVVGFTRTMIDLGESTNLSASDAATALARFANVMGTSQKQFSNLGSAIVYLGNNYATTEREITEMAMRLSGAGRNIKLSEGQVLGLATALSSVGIEAEAGGTAFSRVMVKMQSAVDEGGDALAGFADVAGMSADAFKKLFKKDSGDTLAAFVKGLENVEKRGGSVNEVLNELGFKDVRVSDALRRSAAAADLFSKAMNDGEKAFADNKALSEEAAKRYETTAAKVEMAWNQIKNAAIEVGGVLLPLVGQVAGSVAQIANAFAQLPAPVQAGITGFLGFASVAGLVVGSGMKLATFLSTTIPQMRDLGLVSEKTAGKIGKVGRFVGGLAKKGLLAGLIVEVAELGRNFVVTERSATDMQQALNNVGKSDGLKNLFKDAPDLLEEVGSFKEAISVLNDDSWLHKVDFGLARFAEGAAGLVGADIRSNIMAFQDNLAEVDKHLSRLSSSGSLAQAQQGFKDMAQAMKLSDEEILGLLKAMPEYRKQVEDQLILSGKQITDQELLNVAMGRVSEAAGEQTGELGKVNEALEEQALSLHEVIELQEKLANGYLSESESQIRFIENVQQATEALARNGQNLDINTKQGRDNQRALNDIARSGWDLIKSLEETGKTTGELRAKMSEIREAFIKAATAMGMGQTEASALADKLGLIPDKIKSDVEVKAEKAKKDIEDVQALADKLEGADPVIKIDANTGQAHQKMSEAGKTADDLNQKKSIITLDAKDAFTGNALAAYNSIPTSKTITIYADTSSIKRIGIGGGYSMYASGGAVRGPGTGTSDSIPALLSNGEHVLTAREVENLGGQAKVYALRSMIRSGYAKKVLRLASGGEVSQTPIPVGIKTHHTSSISTPTNFGQQAATVVNIGSVVNPVAEPLTVSIIRQLQKTSWGV